MKTVLITGGAGYIGSHCVLALLKEEYKVIIYDNLSTGHIETVNTLKKYGNVEFCQGDLLNLSYLGTVFKQAKIDAAIHFAAFSQVGESVKDPQKYYINYVCGTLNLLKVMLENNVKKIVFSSTAATLGDAGSPASDTTLGPTAGLNADGQHNHIWDTCVPTFLHYNIPLILTAIISVLIFG